MRTAERQHYWDVTRAVLMLLGLPYHVAMLYHPGGWIVGVEGTSAVLGGLAAFIHAFRMPAFFVVAGYFAAMLLARREPGAWLKGRAVRLGVPLATSLIVLVPVLNILGELSSRPAGEALQEWRYQTMTSGGYWVRHLWFLIVLLYLSAGAALMASLRASSPPARTADRDARLARAMPLVLLGAAIAIGAWEAASIELFYAAGLNTNLVQQILRVDDLLVALPYFVFGFVLQHHPRLTGAFARLSPPVLVVAALSLAAMTVWGEALPPMTGRFVGAFAAVAGTQGVVSLARAFLDRPSPMVRRLVAGSFVIYLFHLPILIGLFDLARLAGLPPALGFPVILVTTLALSWTVWLGIERSPALNLLFNGIVPAGPARRHGRSVRPGLVERLS